MQKLHTLHAHVPLHVSDSYAGYEKDDNLFVLQPQRSERSERTSRINWTNVVTYGAIGAGLLAFWLTVGWVVAEVVAP